MIKRIYIIPAVLILAIAVLFVRGCVRNRTAAVIIENNEKRQLNRAELGKLQSGFSGSPAHEPPPAAKGINNRGLQNSLETINRVQKINNLNKRQDR